MCLCVYVRMRWYLVFVLCISKNIYHNGLHKKYHKRELKKAISILYLADKISYIYVYLHIGTRYGCSRCIQEWCIILQYINKFTYTHVHTDGSVYTCARPTGKSNKNNWISEYEYKRMYKMVSTLLSLYIYRCMYIGSGGQVRSDQIVKSY